MTKDRRSDQKDQQDEKPTLTPFHPPKTREGDEDQNDPGTLVGVDVEDDQGGGSEVM